MEITKLVHISCAVISMVGFILRGLWMLLESKQLQQKWVKISPHIIDTLLLGSAITLAIQMHFSPLQQPWLLAKIVALVLYIILGTIALKRGKTKQIRGVAWIMALVIFGYILATAYTKSPWGYLAMI